MSIEILALMITTMITASASIIVSIITNRGAAHRKDVEALAETVETLQAENTRVNKENAELRGEMKELRTHSLAQDEKIRSQAARIDMVEAENSELSQLTQQQEQRIRHMEDDNGDLRKWAEDLVCQVKELGGEPVQMKRRRKVA